MVQNDVLEDAIADFNKKDRTTTTTTTTRGDDKQKIVDRMRVRALAGKGGNGCASFRKDFGTSGTY